MRKDKKDKNKKAYTVILTKPETIFNEEVVEIVAKSQKTSCATVRKLFKGLIAARADFIQDRPGIYGLLMDAWRYAAANVGGLADMIMETPGGNYPKFLVTADYGKPVMHDGIRQISPSMISCGNRHKAYGGM